MATKKSVKQKADAIAAANAKQKSKETAEGTPVSATGSNTVRIESGYIRDVAFNMPDGRRVIIRGTTYGLRGKDTGIIILGRTQETILDREDWEYIQHKFSGMKLFKNKFIQEAKSSNPVEIAAQTKDMAGNLPKTGLEPIDPEKTAVEPFVAE